LQSSPIAPMGSAGRLKIGLQLARRQQPEEIEMRKIRSGVFTFGAVAALTLVLGVHSADGQSVAVADAEQFVGKWTLTLEPPQGGAFAGAAAGRGGGGGPGGAGGAGAGRGGRMGGPMVLDITEVDGNLSATMAGGMGGTQAIRSITRSGESLVLNYETSGMGQSIPVTLRLTPADDKMNASLDFAGMMNLSGTATKE
jgi:hypothetical protein